MSKNLADSVFYQSIEIGVVSTQDSKNAQPLFCSELVELIVEPAFHESSVVGFSHLTQTDYIRVIEGEVVIVTLFNKQLHYFPLDTKMQKFLVIAPRTWHTLLNPSIYNCHLYNAAQRNRPMHKNDYKPICLISQKFDWSLVFEALVTKQPTF